MRLSYSRGKLLKLYEISIEQDVQTGRYVWKETGNVAEFSVLSDGPVGEGSSRRTYEARRINGISGRLRLKQCISTEHVAQQRFLRTALLQQKLLDHPGTVNATANLFGVYFGEDGHLWEAQDFRDSLCYDDVEETSVHNALTHLRYFAQAVRRYHDLDGETYLLLDISPANLSVFREDSGISGACLFDFDSMLTPAEILQGHTLTVSHRYAAPEVQKGNRSCINRQADMYPLGAILFEKLLGRLPNPISELRSSSQYDFANCTRPQLIEALSPAAKMALTDFFRHTITTGIGCRYFDMDEMLQAIDHLLELTDPTGVQAPRLTRQNIRPTSNFLGRGEVLRSIHDAFALRKHRAVILHGVGGAGKSETARQYAALHQEDYAGINFLVCTATDTDWKTLADRLEFASGGATELDHRNLIILDNFDCEDPALMRSVLVDFLEHTGEARVLVTTRSYRMPALPRCEELPLDENDQLALSVFRANYPRPLSASDAAIVREILSAVEFNTYAADMIARELATRPEWTLTQFLERMTFFGIGRALPDTEISTGKDKDYAPAPFTRQVEKLFADVLTHDFTLQQKLVLFLLIHAPARYFSRSHICRMVGDHADVTLADQAVEQLLRRNWLRQQMVDNHATIGVHPLAAEALSGKLAVTGAMLRTLCVNLLTLTEIGESFFQDMYFLISARKYPDWPAELLAECLTESKKSQEHLRNTMILKALNARLASLSLPLWLDNSDPGNGFGISAVAGDGEAARYFCYLEDQNLSLQYLEILRRDYELQTDQISVEIKEVCPGENDTITLLRVATGDGGDHTFDLAPMVYGTPEDRRNLHSNPSNLRKNRTHKVHPDALSTLCNISRKDFRGGFPTAPVTRIGARAFLGLDALRYVVLPETVREIEHDAFRHSGLTEVTIPGATGRVTIGDFAFFGCDSLTKVTLSEGVLGIFSSAFQNCSALEEVSFPSSLIYLGDNAFSRTALKILTLPEGLATIGLGAFRETPLETVRLPDSLKIIGSYAFSCCKSLKDIRLGNGVIRIGRGSFYGCESLLYLRLPDGAQLVEPAAFGSCFALKTLSLPGSVEFVGLATENCPLEMVLLRGTPTPSLQQQLAANPPQHILVPLSPTQRIRFRRHENQYIPDPQILSVVDPNEL